MTMLLGTWRSLFTKGGALWTPALPTSDGGYLPEHWYISTGPLWQDAGITPAASDGDVVGRWEDITANADHVNQAAAGNKPTLQSGAGDLLNGNPVIRSDGIDDYLQGAFTTGGAMAQPNTIFIVVQAIALAVASGVFYDGDDINNRASLYDDIADDWSMYAGGGGIAGGAADTNWHIWTALFNGAGSEVWIDGISDIAGNPGPDPQDGLTTHCNYAGASQSRTNIAEIILYDANLSDADKNQVGQYLATRYALAYTDI